MQESLLTAIKQEPFWPQREEVYYYNYNSSLVEWFRVSSSSVHLYFCAQSLAPNVAHC